MLPRSHHLRRYTGQSRSLQLIDIHNCLEGIKADLNVVFLSGSQHEPSKATAILTTVMDELVKHIPVQDRKVTMSDIGTQLGSSFLVTTSENKQLSLAQR